MREYTPENITDAVIEQMATTPDPRMKEIMEAAVRHLHAFAREVNLTPAEWIKGIEFMTKVGQMCTPARQEFILLSDTMGLSALVNIMHDKTKMEEATGASLLGPFFRENTPNFERGAQIAKKTDGTEVVLYGRVTNAKGAPIRGAQVTVWQTAADGRYDIQKGIEEIDCRGIFRTDDKGNYLIRTVRPLGYFIPLDGPVGQMVMSQKRARHAARAHPLPDQRAELPRARHGALPRRRRAPRRRRRVRRIRRPRRRSQGQRSGLARRRACPASTSISPSRARRGRQPRRPRRRRSGRYHRGQRQGTSALRRSRRRRWSRPPRSRKKGGILGGLFRGK